MEYSASHIFFLLGLSKGNARVEISASVFFFVQPQFAILLLIRMREDFTDEHMALCNGGRRRVYAVEDQHKYCVRIQNGYKMCTQRSR